MVNDRQKISELIDSISPALNLLNEVFIDSEVFVCITAQGVPGSMVLTTKQTNGKEYLIKKLSEKDPEGEISGFADKTGVHFKDDFN